MDDNFGKLERTQAHIKGTWWQRVRQPTQLRHRKVACCTYLVGAIGAAPTTTFAAESSVLDDSRRFAAAIDGSCGYDVSVCTGFVCAGIVGRGGRKG